MQMTGKASLPPIRHIQPSHIIDKVARELRSDKQIASKLRRSWPKLPVVRKVRAPRGGARGHLILPNRIHVRLSGVLRPLVDNGLAPTGPSSAPPSPTLALV